MTISHHVISRQGIVREILLDEADSDILSMRWRAWKSNDKTFYAAHSDIVDGKSHTTLMHRIILGRVLGRPLETHEQVDHKDLNGLNNQRSNLRLATPSQNNANKSLPSNNTSGYKCIYPRGRRFRVIMWVEGKEIWIGSYKTLEAAILARDEAAKKYFGEFARLD